MEIRRSALVEHSAARMFQLIEAAEHYPEFLPWCVQAVILERDEHIVAARISVGYRNVALTLSTRNRKEFPTWMSIQIEQGPFRRFEGEWRLRELAAQACKIEFNLHYEFDNSAIAAIAAPAMERIATRLVDAFVMRADALAQSAPPLPSSSEPQVN